MRYILADKSGQIYAEYSSRAVAESVYVDAILFKDLIIVEVEDAV